MATDSAINGDRAAVGRISRRWFRIPGAYGVDTEPERGMIAEARLGSARAAQQGVDYASRHCVGIRLAAAAWPGCLPRTE